ncbi:MAG: helix-turn-helix transcriptional regulator [Clostridia bacterium]|nr:helix-turn-helix transcriptional regulator [Clostridia bacterium]
MTAHKINRKRLAELLSSRKITAYKLAQMLGYKDSSKTTVYKWIYGEGEPNAATMLKLMEILDVSALDILRIFAEGTEKV